MAGFGKFKVHPVAALFPLIEGEEFAKLVTDIKANGLIEPIVLSYDEKSIIDGRNRWRACEEGGVDPVYTKLGSHYTEFDLVLFILSKNLRRRHLDVGQRTMLGLELLPYFEAEAKERQKEHGKTAPGRKSLIPKSGEVIKAPRAVDLAAAAVNVGHSAVSQGKKIKDHSAVLAADVAAGKVSLNDAHKQVRRAEAASQAATEKEAPSRATAIVRTHDGQEAEYQLPKGRAKFNATNDQVSWAAWTWNPATGCLHNCPYCYAREGAVMNKNLRPFYPFGFTPTFYDYRLEAPANSKVPKGVCDDARLGRVFVSSMGDLFGKWVPDEWIAKVFAAAHAAPEWEYLFLTKFPQRYVGLDLPPTAWIGTTVDDQYRVKIAEQAFRKVKGVRVKWLSLEPLLAPLEFTDLSMFDFVVIGSQSSTEQPDGLVPELAPPFEWVARITAQAREAGCKVYQKPNLLGVTDPQHAGMKLIQEVPDLPPLPRTQGEFRLIEAAE